MEISQSEIRRVVLGAVLSIFLSALDQTIVATALPKIAADLGNFSQVSWVVTAYLLTGTSITLIAGKLCDLFGRRTMLRLSVGAFVVGSVLCAVAPSMLMLILARAIQGLGGGAIFTVSQTVVADVVSPRERGRYATYFAAVWAAASVLGPTIGGFVTANWGWPWIFWINIPFGCAALAVADRVLARLPGRRPDARIDYRGVTLLTLATTCGLLVLSLGGKRLAWTSPWTVALAAIAICFGILFWLVQVQSSEPIVPPRFLKDRVIWPALMSSFVIYGGFVTLSALTPIYLQVARGVPVGQAGLMMIPLMLASSVMAYFGSRRSARTGRYKKPTLIGIAFAALSLSILAWSATEIAPIAVAFLLLIVGGGMGPFFPASIVAAQNAVEQRDLGAVNGAVIFVRTMGAAFGVAAGSALVLGIAAEALIKSGNFGDLETLTERALSPEVRTIVAHAFGVSYGAMAAAMLIAFAVFAIIEDRELRGGPQTAALPVGE
jgi:EmrB/QacA subfamily drug resistance transporter